MQLGCVRVTERALGRGIVSSDNESVALRMIEGEINKAFESVPSFEKLIGNVELMGLAGTVATLAQLDAGLTTYERSAVHLRSLSRDIVGKWYAILKDLSPEQRLALPGMVPGREDVMASGLLILGAVMDRLEVDALVSSENDILDGVVASLLGS
jgi:exopolyphosphatase/guanosine-5'-triphosphate,3'-diphosphate pyrophosphatase